MRLLFLLVFISLSSYSQKVIIDDLGALKNVGIDSLNNELLLFYEDYYEKLDLKTYDRKQFKLYVDKPFDYGTFIVVDTLQYFVPGDGGRVYQFKNDTIKRIDNSFDHRMQSGSNIFSYNSKIYKYGGYGFWSVRNFFIFFDKITKEWEVDDLVSSKDIPQGTYGGLDIKIGNEIYLFDGQKIDPHKRLERIKNNEVWKYNLKSKQWKYLGKNSPIERKVTIKYKNKLLNSGLSNIAEIDVINNKITLYDHNILSPRLHLTFKSFYLNNKFYCFTTKRGKASLKVIEEKDFFGKKISSKIFYKNYPYWIFLFLVYFLTPFLFLILIWLGIKYYKKNQKIVLLENGLRYKDKFAEFDKESMQIIKLLLYEDEVYSNQILKIVEKEQYSLAHNERIKVQRLNDIDLKIKMLLGTNDDVIRSVKSESDRRIRIYRISREYFG
ncbi:MAG: hypothetical protein ABFR32_09600 [Bacteroidota bacterium]